MKKGLKIALIVIALVVIFAIVGFVMVAGASTRTAFLKIDSGTVEVDTGKGWENALDNMDLSLEDKVRTVDGEAAVILYESIIIQLEPNTEIMIKDLAKENVVVKQESGSTWNKFTGLSGIEGYEVETPTTVATVRGTEFGVDLEEILVAEGEVDVTVNGETRRVLEGLKAKLKDGKLVLSELTPEEKRFIAVRMEKSLALLRELRKAQLEKHSFLLKIAKRRYNLTDENIERGFLKFDRGELTEEEVLKKSPVPIENLPVSRKSVNNFKELNTKIRNQQQLLNKLRENAQG